MISFNLSRGSQFKFSSEKTSMLNLLSENFIIYYDHIRLKNFVLTIIYNGYSIHTEKIVFSPSLNKLKENGRELLSQNKFPKIKSPSVLF